MESRPGVDAERRPEPATLSALVRSVDAVLGNEGYLPAARARVAEGLPRGHLMLDQGFPLDDLLGALLGPLRGSEGGPSDDLLAAAAEARWFQLGGWLGGLGVEPDACPSVVRAVARAARDVLADDWTSAGSSDWAALHLWMVGTLTLGASSATPPPARRARGEHPAEPAVEHPAARPAEPAAAAGEPAEPAIAVVGLRAVRARKAEPRRSRGGEAVARAWSASGGLEAMRLAGAPASAVRAVQGAAGVDDEDVRGDG